MTESETLSRARIWSLGYSSLYRGDALRLLAELPDGCADGVVCDPPYCSGGFTRGDRMQSTALKYVVQGTAMVRPDFSGDTRDQRGFLAWATMWLSECYRITRPGGLLLMFTDWRQLPIGTDAIQAAGWVWRGIVPWDKTEGARPQKGFFRAQCEYVLTASKGGMGKEQDRGDVPCAPGLFRYSRSADARIHMTGKPVALMEDLLQVFPRGAHIVDPFVGSGSTMLGGLRRGLRVTGMELTQEYSAIAQERLDAHFGLRVEPAPNSQPSALNLATEEPR